MGEIKVTEKSTKVQILEAYNQALKELETLKAMNDSPIETAKNEALKASLENAEVAAKNSVFSEEIIKQYKDLKIAIDEYKKELEKLYGIKAEADSLAAVINAHKFKIADMDAEYKKLKEEQDVKLAKRKAEVSEEIEELDNKLSKAKIKADEEAAEYETELKKKRTREADEYKYNLKMNRKADFDAWDEEKTKREAEIQKQEEAVEAREDAIAEKEEEIQEMKKKIEAFPGELEIAKEEAAKEAKAKAERSFLYEKRALESDKKHADEMAAAEITNLKEQVEALKQTNSELTNKLDDAYKKMNEVATATVQAGATVKVVSSDK
ncbi:MAG TPA: hypothetical protein DCW90_09930 [Lachnospiraceae bacterium]|nr:hypothetical protein [Lachnospiraceae bacterium]